MDDLFAGAGALRGQYEAVDWSDTSIGPPGQWTPALRNALALAFGTRFAVTLLWGPELVLLYNEAYTELIGEKHPRALGRPCAEVFPEAMDSIGPLLEQVMGGGSSTWAEEALLPLHRHGYLEDCWFTWSYSAVRGLDGEVEGVLDIAVESTFNVLARRRGRLVATLRERLEEAGTEAEVVKVAVEVLTGAEDLVSAELPEEPAPGPGVTIVAGGDARGADVRVEIPSQHSRTQARHLRARLCPRLPLDEPYRELLRSLAATVAAALDAVEVRESERRVSEALQHSLLTQPRPGSALEVAVRYQPASLEAQVGGDWYDAYPLPDGAVALMVGDVAGHDQTAAAAMGQLRNLARGVAYSAEVWLPSQVLGDLDLAMAGLGVDEVATAIIAVLEELGPDGHLVHWSNAGHPPPLLRTAAGEVRLLDESPDLLLGLDPSSVRADHQLPLAPGDLLLLYTDGLVERRDADLDEGLDWLVELVRSHPDASPEELCTVLLREVPTHDDDQVLLAVRSR
jgi:hypothetical protein